jgi:tRNA(Ile)-lysidine synthase
MRIVDHALRTIRRFEMTARGGRVGVAVSAGADSVALLHVLLALQERGELVVAGVAHFNHQLRGTDSDADEAFCAELAHTLGLRFEHGREDVRARAPDERRSIEDAARRARYAFLRAAAVPLQASAVAVGHTLDDQAETFLLRLVRGSGSRGLAGIRPKAGLIIRPLLDTRRQDLRDYMVAGGWSHREDATNADVTIPRNRVRHELLPYLERHFSERIAEILAREAVSAREDEERLQAEAIDLASSIVLSTEAHTTLAVDADALTSLHPALGARVAREALTRGASERFVGFEHIHRFLEFAADARPGAALSLPGQQALLRFASDGVGGAGPQGRRVIELGPEPPRASHIEGGRVPSQRDKRGGGAEFRFLLSIPGEVVLSPQGLAVSASWAAEEPGTAAASAGCVVAGAKLPLAVRSRRPGDRFHPPGLGGRSKKLQDYLVDRKVARTQRDLLPLVVDGDDRIVWIVGHAVSEAFRAAVPSNGVIFLKARHLGGAV